MMFQGRKGVWVNRAFDWGVGVGNMGIGDGYDFVDGWRYGVRKG